MRITYELRARASSLPRPIFEQWASEHNALMIARSIAKEHAEALVTLERVTTARGKEVSRQTVYESGRPATVEAN